MIYGKRLSWWKDAGEGFVEEGNLDLGNRIVAADMTDDLQTIYATSGRTILVVSRNESQYYVQYSE